MNGHEETTTLPDFGRGSPEINGRISFDRRELGRILSLYSQRVAAGEWRDYAIDQMQGRATFSIFRHTQSRPLFTITKWGGTDWEIANGCRTLMQTDSLDKALTIFARELRVVS